MRQMRELCLDVSILTIVNICVASNIFFFSSDIFSSAAEISMHFCRVGHQSIVKLSPKDDVYDDDLVDDNNSISMNQMN